MPQDATAVQRPDSSRATAIQRPLSAVQRSAGRSSGSIEGTRPLPSLDRRRSSLLSDFSFEDARQSVRSSTDSLLLPKPASRERSTQAESSLWHSAPLAFAIFPAVGGLLFQNGSEIVTDICLLALAAIFLNWSIRLPWEWYHAAQAVQLAEPETGLDPTSTGTIVEESSEDEKPDSSSLHNTTAAATEELSSPAPGQKPAMRSAEREAASARLRSHEMVALAFCFIGPVIGTALLHAIRSQLSRPSEGLVSDFNLTIFLLAAELRPSSHLIALVQTRTLHLQRVAQRSEIEDSMKGDGTQDLNKRLEEVEARLADLLTHEPPRKDAKDGRDPTTAEVINNIRRIWQPQLDDLTRAVRRYEKRATTQTIQTEARLQDLENRLRDALALAAAAAKSGQEPGVVAVGLEWISTMFMLQLRIARFSVVYPLQLALAPLLTAKAWVLGPTPDKRRKGQSKADDHGAVNGHRAQSKPARR